MLEGLGREIDGLRHLITELRPAALDDLGLEAALQALARRAQAIDGLDVQIEIDLRPGASGDRVGRATGQPAPGPRAREHDLPDRPGGADEREPPCAGHAGGGRASPSATACVRASVTDDGRGLPDAAQLGPRGDGLEGGFGISGMRERAELVGGELELAPGAGARDRRAPDGAPGRTARAPAPAPPPPTRGARPAAAARPSPSGPGAARRRLSPRARRSRASRSRAPGRS